jgi:hypothetical protein
MAEDENDELFYQELMKLITSNTERDLYLDSLKKISQKVQDMDEVTEEVKHIAILKLNGLFKNIKRRIKNPHCIICKNQIIEEEGYYLVSRYFRDVEKAGFHYRFERICRICNECKNKGDKHG